MCVHARQISIRLDEINLNFWPVIWDYLYARDSLVLTSFRSAVSVVSPPRRRRKGYHVWHLRIVKGGFDVYNIETAMPKIDLDAIESHLRAAREEERRVSNQHSFHTNQ